jgi:hypothetical protein
MECPGDAVMIHRAPQGRGRQLLAMAIVSGVVIGLIVALAAWGVTALSHL